MTASATIDQFNERAKAEVSAGEVIEINAALKMLAKDQSMVMCISSSTGADYRMSRILFDYFKHQIDDKGADYADIVMVIQSACDAFGNVGVLAAPSNYFGDMGMFGQMKFCFGNKFLAFFIYNLEAKVNVVHIATIVGAMDYLKDPDSKPLLSIMN